MFCGIHLRTIWQEITMNLIRNTSSEITLLTLLPHSPIHDDVIKWKRFPRYWPFVRAIHRFPVNSPHKGQWRGALMFSLICVWISGWVNNREAGDLRRYRAHYDVTVTNQWVKRSREDTVRDTDDLSPARNSTEDCMSAAWSGDLIVIDCPGKSPSTPGVRVIMATSAIWLFV